MSRHAQKVDRIAKQLRAHTGGRPVSLKKKSVSHQVPKAGDLRHRDDKIDISDLTEIIEIDPVRRVCVAESGVTFVDLVSATLRHNLVPIVVPELKTITIGGAVAGCSIESMSFVHGGFHDTCLEYEVITANGDVITCTPDNEHKLVFQMIHGGFGTLGVLSKLTFRLVPAKQYVKLVYERHTTLASYQDSIARHAEKRDIDFMDGIIHSPSLYVLSVGTFVDRAPYTNRYDWMKVYYQSTAKRTEDYLETAQYFFRYDRGVTNVRPSSFIGRLLFGKLLASSEWLRIAEKVHFLLPRERPTVTLDVFVPSSKVPEFMEWYEREIGFFPLWCVPYRRVHNYEWLTDEYWQNNKDSMFLDLAIYGMRQPPGRNVHREIEIKLRELGGIKTLISHNYYGEDEFWSIFNKSNYDAVKAITDPRNVFRDLYTKMCKAAMGTASAPVIKAPARARVA
ncbi:MAG TPA: FAD-binding oxidoreductase [Kofleriaceae bacterium]|nr:FAD-binding oxidoreductase [Kofleriaceae bacterium]